MSADKLPPAHRGGDFAVHHRLLVLSAFALVIGAMSSAGAALLLSAIRLFTNLFFFQSMSLVAHSPADHHLGPLVILVPACGGLIVGLMARFGTENIRGHGIPEALEAILFGKSRMSAKVAILKPLSSGVAIGSGGPFGAEGPIIMTGGAAASLLAQAFHMTAAERKALLVAGACAGMTAVFATPVAAVLLAVELLLFELRPRSLLPVAISCAVAGFLRPLWAGPGPLFPLETPAVSTIAMLSCCIAGIASGAVSALLTQLLYRIEDLFHRLPIHWMWWPAIGGLVVGIGGYFQPRAFGVGYDVIGDLLQHHLLLSAALALLAVKAGIWVVALGSGTSGGVLAPLLMIGAGVGSVLSAWLPGGSPPLWALVCMAAVLGGTMRAPLTAVVFAFGLTHDVNALLPTLLSSVIAYGFTVMVMRRSILTEKIARRGRHVFREYAVDPLDRHFVDEVMTRHVVSIEANEIAAEALTKYFGTSQRHRAYPVVDRGRLLGMLNRELLQGLSAEQLTKPVLHLPFGRLAFALPSDTCRSAAMRLVSETPHLERLPVVDNPESQRVVGIVSYPDLLKTTRIVHEEEAQRERSLPFGAVAAKRVRPSTP
jgi:chloride channel protein, CIC family